MVYTILYILAALITHTRKTMSNIKKASEIIQALIFLGIPTEDFSKLKAEHGGLNGLYNYITNKL